MKPTQSIMLKNIEPTMLLVTAEWQDKNSFKLIPMTQDCPFSEGIFDIKTKVLALMSYQSKDSLHLVPKIDNQGDMKAAKRPRKNEKNYEEERIKLDTFVEYYVSIPEEIDSVIKMIALNAKSFDYKQYMKKEEVEPVAVPVETLPKKSTKEKPTKKSGTAKKAVKK